MAKNIFGYELYQRRARVAFPILVRQADAKEPITYEALAAELGMPNPRNLNFVLANGSAHTTLDRARCSKKFGNAWFWPGALYGGGEVQQSFASR
jgi:hypothetical protein